MKGMISYISFQKKDLYIVFKKSKIKGFFSSTVILLNTSNIKSCTVQQGKSLNFFISKKYNNYIFCFCDLMRSKHILNLWENGKKLPSR